MERYKVILAYDGTLFYGFQRQGQVRTVQLEVEAALRRLNWQGRTILSSGRTDSGVHAAGQVIAFDLEWHHSLQDLGRALNANLPEDVAVKSVELAPADFHPRYDAVSRCYHYQVLFAPERDPLQGRYTWRVWPPCEVESLQAAARLLHGTHDFAAFGTPPRPGGSTIRTVFQADWQPKDEAVLLFQVTGNAFLYHMVRRMVFLQVLVGQRRLSLEAFQDAVEKAAQLPPGLAPPQGLILKEVRYGDRAPVDRGRVTQE
ncbi:MAG: tRNA pseudouridine(38-40) synthase TruA [Chloroflexi bacterium]|nr:tRNA pseudouridine(38-40) synthase TruA [Chloroflexota bacterium]